MPVEPELVLGLPVDALALHLLKKFDDESIVLHRYNFFVIADSAYKNAGAADPGGILRALAEALDWLTQHGLISANGQGDFITRKGYKVLQNENGLDLVQAEARIDVDLHPRIGDRVRSQFLLGEYSTAVLLVMREVEIRVLELVGPVDVDKEN